MHPLCMLGHGCIVRPSRTGVLLDTILQKVWQAICYPLTRTTLKNGTENTSPTSYCAVPLRIHKESFQKPSVSPTVPTIVVTMSAANDHLTWPRTERLHRFSSKSKRKVV
eukprot:scaffold7769_cov207-Alexandrium_tamarense.AAC.2